MQPTSSKKNLISLNSLKNQWTVKGSQTTQPHNPVDPSHSSVSEAFIVAPENLATFLFLDRRLMLSSNSSIRHDDYEVLSALGVRTPMTFSFRNKLSLSSILKKYKTILVSTK